MAEILDDKRVGDEQLVSELKAIADSAATAAKAAKTIDELLCTTEGGSCSSTLSFPQHLREVKATAIVHDSRLVTEDSLFFAIKGYKSDGHNFASAALKAGAVAVVAEHIPEEAEGLADSFIIVENSRISLACAAATFYNRPSKQLNISGITGTNGKTTTIYLMDAIARAAGEQSGVIGTVESKYNLQSPCTTTAMRDRTQNTGQNKEQSEYTGLPEECAHNSLTTTPDALQLQSLFAEMRDAGVQSVAMEVSSHAIDMHRVEQTSFAVVAFTNLSQDHLDYHNTMEEYQRVKERLFSDFETNARVINIDDRVGAELAARLMSEGLEVICVGMKEPEIDTLSLDLSATELVQGSHITEFLLTTPNDSAHVSFPLVGKYNVENALVAAGCAWSRGIAVEVIAKGLSCVAQVSGRLEQVEAGQNFKVFVDYAHTPDALTTALGAVREQTTGRVISVFGCGGDRDPLKRPLMGRAACAGSDYLVVTSDNPRSESPTNIVADILKGLSARQKNCDVIIDRREAIFHAVALADKGDSILIAGKGHEDYQIFVDHRVHFDDREVAREALSCLKG